MSPVLNALIYGLPGIAIGFVVGRLTRKEVTYEVEHEKDGQPVRLRLNWQKLFGALVLLVTLASSLLVIHRQNAAADCAEQAFGELTQQLNIGSQIGAERDDAYAQLLRTILSATTPEEGTKAINDYLAAKADRDARLAARGPYRTFEQVCG